MYPAVLIVDDESTIIDSLDGILSDDGFEVIHAFNGYEALKKIDSHSPDIVLLDIWMPGMDGIDTLQEIKRHHPHLPVTMITGRSGWTFRSPSRISSPLRPGMSTSRRTASFS